MVLHILRDINLAKSIQPYLFELSFDILGTVIQRQGYLMQPRKPLKLFENGVAHFSFISVNSLSLSCIYI